MLNFEELWFQGLVPFNGAKSFFCEGSNITFSRSITMFCGIDNILQNIVNPTKHCYRSKKGYAPPHFLADLKLHGF